MMRLPFSILAGVAVVALSAAACTPATEESAAPEAATEAAPVEPEAPDTAAIEAALPEPGAPYWTARATLLEAGFTPVDVNDTEFTACPTAHEEQRHISLDECPVQVVALPEVVDCAGTGLGQCLTHWQTPDGRFLSIVTVDGPQPGVVQSLEWLDARPTYEGEP